MNETMNNRAQQITGYKELTNYRAQQMTGHNELTPTAGHNNQMTEVVVGTTNKQRRWHNITFDKTQQLSRQGGAVGAYIVMGIGKSINQLI